MCYVTVDFVYFTMGNVAEPSIDVVVRSLDAVRLYASCSGSGHMAEHGVISFLFYDKFIVHLK